MPYQHYRLVLNLKTYKANTISMATQRYAMLLTEFCKITQLDEPEKLINTGALSIDDLPVTIQYIADQDIEFIQFFIDIAERPAQAEQCYRRLLEFNFLVHRYGSGLVCLEPGSDRISYSVMVKIVPELTGLALAEILDKAVAQACWVKEHYLSEQADEKAVSPQLSPLA